jgi:hypothetical protein
MSKKSKTLLVLSGLLVGLLLTFATIFNDHISQKLHCPSNSAVDTNVVCSPEIDNRGFPLAYMVNDVPNDNFRTVDFILDLAGWSIVAWAVIYGVKKVKS